jgi:hypothetical protein
MSSALELTDKVPSSWPALAAMLGKIPPKDVPISLPPRLAVVGKTRQEVRALFNQWAVGGTANLKKAVTEATKGLG